MKTSDEHLSQLPASILAFAKETQGRKANNEDQTPFTAAQASRSWNLQEIGDQIGGLKLYRIPYILGEIYWSQICGHKKLTLFHPSYFEQLRKKHINS